MNKVEADRTSVIIIPILIILSTEFQINDSHNLRFSISSNSLGYVKH